MNTRNPRRIHHPIAAVHLRSIGRQILPLFLIFFLPLLAQAQSDDSTHSDWSFSVSGYFYFVPHDKNLLSAVAAADHKNLHLETRYNYEDLYTQSVFGGWTFEKPGKFQLGVTPMIGFMFGRSNGFIPALELNASFKWLSFYSETEYVIDFAGKENDYLYVWGELAASLGKKLQIGFSYQKTRLYQSGLSVQKGAMIKYSFWKLTAGAYYFNPFSDDDLLILSLGIDF